jgi:hypothetical protein
MSDIPELPRPTAAQPQPVYPSSAYKAPALGGDPDDRQEITGLFGKVEAILRYPRRIFFQLSQSGAASVIAGLILATGLSALVYGVIVGSFSGSTQLWAAPIKITLGLFATAMICLPSLYIFACLSGSRARLVEVLGLLVGLLALMTLLLIGFAPVAWIFSRSIDSLPGMGFLHLLFWVISTAFGLRFLKTGFAHLGIRTSAGIHVWSIIFILVNLQMSTALRPLIGTSPEFITSEKRFFIIHWIRCIEESSRANQPKTPTR